MTSLLTRLREFLHDLGSFPAKTGDLYGFSELHIVLLIIFTGALYQHSEIRAQPSVNCADVTANIGDFVVGFLFDKDRTHFFFNCNDHSVAGLDSQGSVSFGYRVQSVFDLKQLSFGGKGREREITHSFFLFQRVLIVFLWELFWIWERFKDFRFLIRK